MVEALDTLTDKEKETLRLVLRGHDAKSMARELDLSIHTINERLRHARRKLEVTSSREAARMLHDAEGERPNLLGDKQMGDAEGRAGNAGGTASKARIGRAGIIAGALVMSFLFALLALSNSLPALQVADGDTRSAQVIAEDAAMEEAARSWLALVDAGQWQESFDATGSVFRELNTQQMWEDASLQARVPLGEVRSREAIAFELVPTPPSGHAIVRFRTDFATRQGVIETVSMAREDGTLKVVGYVIG